jgi:hypothetical protein
MTTGCDENERKKRLFKKYIDRLNRSILKEGLEKTQDIETAIYVGIVRELSVFLDRDCKDKDLVILVVVSGCRIHNKENCGCGEIEHIEDRWFNGYPDRPDLVPETLKKFDIIDEVVTLNDFHLRP